LSASPDAKALRDRLLRQLNLDFEQTDDSPGQIAIETQWPGVAGMYELKSKLERDLILALRYPEEAKRYDVPLPDGILLYGPPGCGKTFMARKIAEKLGFNFKEVKPGDLANIYVHGTQGMIRDLFLEAAKNAPTVLFFDELDAFTPKRQVAQHHYSAEVNEFLVRLNKCSEQRVLVIGATNFAERLDEAILRAGRLDQHYYVGVPDFAARVELFKQHLKSRPCAVLNWEQLGKSSERYTAADIEFLTTQAARQALAERKRIEMKHLQKAMDERPPAGVEQHVRIGFRA
jgi:transitional endoplasmic reticulum ATPase